MNPIKKEKGPCLILAGAGTGKTHTIVEKIKHLISKNTYNPEKIVAITFSNEAANNLYARIKPILKDDKEPVIKTFHAFSADLIRNNTSEKFSVITPNDAKVILNKYFGIAPTYCHKYINEIGIAKDIGINLQDMQKYILENYNEKQVEEQLKYLQFELQTLYLKENKETKKEISEKINELNKLKQTKKFIDIWSGYEKLKQKRNYKDYSDLNIDALNILKQKPAIAQEYEYIIVDEFQDTNKIQIELLKHITPHKNITVVGDLNQSIYRFRGAYKNNVDEFKEIFQVSENDIFTLDKSFRSPNTILSTAHKLISHNYENKSECFEVKSAFEAEGKPIQVYELKDSKEEARRITEIIQEQNNQGKKLEDICVIFRTHQQGRLIKATLELTGTPYHSISKNSLLKERKIKAVMSYLKILNNLLRKEKRGEENWWDLVYNLEFSQNDIIKFGQFLKQNKQTENLNALIFSSLNKIPFSETGKIYAQTITKRINYLLENTQNKKITETLTELYNLLRLTEEETEKEDLMNLNKFYELTKNYQEIHSPDLPSFIHYLTILENLNIQIECAETEKRGVRLMTAHSTKGLEYDTIIITNLAQKRFPSEKFSNNSLIPLKLHPELQDKTHLSKQELEEYTKEYEYHHNLLEERRLCYVSFTRAKQNLFLTYAKKYGNRRFLPSTFLNEINYKQNPIINFQIDNKELYKTLEPKTQNQIQETPQENENLDLLKKQTFSPSSLLTFADCQKKFEYKYIYNMPDKKIVAWEQVQLGSFIHLVLEQGVKQNLKTLQGLKSLARQLHREPEWESIDLTESVHLLSIFFERNKHKYNENSKTEQKLFMEIQGLKFIGFADRIDTTPKGLEIIDYKTGSSNISPRNRNWQLGYYALAAQKLGNVHKVTLETLKKDYPLEFEIDKNKIARSVHTGKMEFSIEEIKKELVQTAQEIISTYKNGFKACPIEKNCPFCNEYVYDI